MGRLVLHIGMHKTGSSSIQRFFSRNRHLLRMLGVSYPDAFAPDGKRLSKHNNLFEAMSHEKDMGEPHPVYGPSETMIVELADEVRRSKVTLISAEGLSGEFDIFAERFSVLRDRVPVTVIVYLRRQDDWIRSFHAQMVRMGEMRSLPEFLEDPDVQRHLDYADLLGRWETALGRDTLQVEIFPPRDNLLQSFLKAASLPRWLACLPYAKAHVNRSEFKSDAPLPDAFMNRFNEGNEWIRRTFRPDLTTLFY